MHAVINVMDHRKGIYNSQLLTPINTFNTIETHDSHQSKDSPMHLVSVAANKLGHYLHLPHLSDAKHISGNHYDL